MQTDTPLTQPREDPTDPTITTSNTKQDEPKTNTSETNETTSPTSQTAQHSTSPANEKNTISIQESTFEGAQGPDNQAVQKETDTETTNRDTNEENTKEINIINQPNYDGYEPDSSSDESENSNVRNEFNTFLEENSQINSINSITPTQEDEPNIHKYNNSKSLKVCKQIIHNLASRYIQTLHTELLVALLLISYVSLGEIGLISSILLIITNKTYKFFQNPQTPSNDEINTTSFHSNKTSQNDNETLIDLDIIDDHNTDHNKEPIFLRDLPSLVPVSTKYLCKGKINGVSLRFEIDTGACCSVLTSNIFEKIKNKNNLKKIEGGTLTDFQGNTLQGSARYQLNVGLNNVAKAVHVFAVVENRKAHALLGVDFLRSKRIDVINTGSSPYLQFTRNKIEHKILLDSEQSIHSLHQVDIESGETRNVIMTIKQDDKHTILPTNKTGIAKMSPQDHLLLPKEGLVEVQQDGTFPIPITNTGYGTITLFPKEQYGSFESLPPDTILQNTKTNEIETPLERNNTQINLINFSDNFSLNPSPPYNNDSSITLYFAPSNQPYPAKTPQNPGPLIVSDTGTIDNQTLCTQPVDTNPRIDILTNTRCQKQILSVQFWINLFSNLFELLKHHKHITINTSNLHPLSINNCRLGFKTSFEETKTLTIQHKTLEINKIRCGTDDESDSTFSEEDLVEDLFYKIRIPDSKTVWTQVLKDVPTHVQDKVFYLLTQKHCKIVSKHSTDFGECTVEGSDFRIDLTSDVPFTAKPYPLNSVYQQQVDQTVAEMIAANLLIEESSSYGTGVFIRARPDQSGTGNFRVRTIYGA